MTIIEKAFDKIMEFSKSNIFSKIVGICLIILISLIPIYIYFLLMLLFGAVGFWQLFILFVFWCIALGWIQVFMLLLAIPAIFFIIEEG